jgi:hypothetical protein
MRTIVAAFLAACLSSPAFAETRIVWGKVCEVLSERSHPQGRVILCRWANGATSYVIKR